MIDMADLNGDDEIDYAELSAVIECDDIVELAALVPDKKVVSAAKTEVAKKIGKYGCTVGQLKAAAKLIRERLLMKNATVMKALRDVDESGDGIIDRGAHLQGDGADKGPSPAPLGIQAGEEDLVVGLDL